MNDEAKPQVQRVTVEADVAGQRIDNFLRTRLKGVPKSMIYRLLRKGQVRVNGKRCKAEYKLSGGDEVRIPPVRTSEEKPLPSARLNVVSGLAERILYEDDHLLAVDKPAGMAVHGGSGISFGVIEGLRALRPESRFLELVHRLDRDTSGVLLLAKKRSALRALHEQLRHKTMRKHYLALVRGQWALKDRKVDAPLRKNVLASGERIVRVSADGKPSETRFRIVERFAEATLVRASPITGRTHQIRVHTACRGHAIAGDPKYGESGFNQRMRESGLKRLFLHASQLSVTHPAKDDTLTFDAPLGDELERLLARLRRA